MVEAMITEWDFATGDKRTGRRVGKGRKEVLLLVVVRRLEETRSKRQRPTLGPGFWRLVE